MTGSDKCASCTGWNGGPTGQCFACFAPEHKYYAAREVDPGAEPTEQMDLF